MCPAQPGCSVGRAQVVAAARKWIGIPFAHIGRNEHAVDCAGLVIAIAHELRLSDFDMRSYNQTPDGVTMRALCDQHMVPKDGDPEPGDVLLMRFKRNPQHLAIVGDYPVPGQVSIIHAHRGAMKCVEHILNQEWRERIVRVYTIPGVV